MKILKASLLLFCLASLMAGSSFAQDTVRVSLQKFITEGVQNSGEVDAERQEVNLAQNRIRETQSQRYVPTFELNTQHGVIPGVKSDREDLDPNEFYLDPNLENDFEDIGLFTRAELDLIQPIFTWGGLKNAVSASQAAAKAAESKFQITKNKTELRLYKLYQSYLLSLELNRLLSEAQDQIDDIGGQLEEKKNEEGSDLDDSDVFKFNVFKSEFAVRKAEVEENSKYIQNVWNYVMQASDGTVFIPEKQFLDPVQNELKTLSYYRNKAVNTRPEVKGLEAGIEVAEFGVKAQRAEYYPSLFLGLRGRYAITPNRPRQSNPFIINSTNYSSASIGFGIRQNLDFFSLRFDVKKRKIQKRKAEFSKNAAMDGIVLQVNDKYKEASLSQIKVERRDEALVTSKKWLRQEQLDYDFGMNNTKDLVDAIQKKLQLQVQYKREIFNFNKNMAELYDVSALPVGSLNTNF
jgi:outer membrane protein TolC